MDRTTIAGALAEERHSYIVRLEQLRAQQRAPEAQTPEAQAHIRARLAALAARLTRCEAALARHAPH
jgi:hypothetical protein